MAQKNHAHNGEFDNKIAALEAWNALKPLQCPVPLCCCILGPNDGQEVNQLCNTRTAQGKSTESGTAYVGQMPTYNLSPTRNMQLIFVQEHLMYKFLEDWLIWLCIFFSVFELYEAFVT